MLDDITADQVRDLLEYDRDTGMFRWRTRRGKIMPGSIAGSPNNYGHFSIKINNRLYKSHRLAWLIVHGEWPSEQIDHINRDPGDNRIANLREATYSENAQNTLIPRSNTSGHKGVSWHKRMGKWMAHIRLNKRKYFLGYFDKAESARDAYLSAARVMHTRNPMAA